MTDELPQRLAEIVEEFAGAPREDKLELLLEYSQLLPPLPERFAQHPERLEPVPECQSPVFLVTELDADGHVRLFFDAPPQSPTTRGFAGIFHAGLDGQPPDEVLAVPADITARLGLAEVVSPLRLRGAAAMLYRLQRQVSALVAAG